MMGHGYAKLTPFFETDKVMSSRLMYRLPAFRKTTIDRQNTHFLNSSIDKMGQNSEELSRIIAFFVVVDD